MNDDRVFEFAANSLIRFRLHLFTTGLTLESLPRKGEANGHLVNAQYADLVEANLSERVGRRSRTSSVNLKMRGGKNLLLAWGLGPMGTKKEDGKIYYAAASELLRRLAAHHPGMMVKLAPGSRGGYIVGAAIGLAIALYLAGAFDGPWTLGSWGGLVVATAIMSFSVWRSGILKKSRKLSLEAAASEFEAKAAAL